MNKFAWCPRSRSSKGNLVFHGMLWGQLAQGISLNSATWLKYLLNLEFQFSACRPSTRRPVLARSHADLLDTQAATLHKACWRRSLDRNHCQLRYLPMCVYACHAPCCHTLLISCIMILVYVRTATARNESVLERSAAQRLAVLLHGVTDLGCIGCAQTGERYGAWPRLVRDR